MKKLIFLLLTGSFCVAACNNGGNDADGNKDKLSLGESIRVTADSLKSKVNAATDSVQSAASGFRENDFVSDVIKSNANEIAWLNAGISRGTDKELKSHARKMLADHQKMGTEVKNYAVKMNYSIPETDTADAVNLNDTPGSAWDKSWADKMVNDHQDLISKFENNQDKVEDPGLKNMITKSLPTLKAHLDQAIKLQTRLQGSNP